MQKLTITRPDDWHLHVRTGAVLQTVIPHTARQFGRAIIMPNLIPPVTTVAQATTYREEIMQAVPENNDFNPLMTLYLTESTAIDEIRKVSESEHVHALKLYPAGATTNSESGVSTLSSIYPILEEMEKLEVPLLIHGEVTDKEIDIFDREREFIEKPLTHIVAGFPDLRIVVEHVTTREAVQFVQSASANVAATITPQHLMFNRNAILAGGIRPHHYCLPIIKRESHRRSLIEAAVSGDPKFFLGTDSAPHLKHLKESSCGCAGCYSAHAALELYAEIFDQNNALARLEGFASHFGADFYRMPRNTKKITLEKTSWSIPNAFKVDNNDLVPLKAGEQISWKLCA